MNDDMKSKSVEFAVTLASPFMYIPFCISLILYYFFSIESFLLWGFGIGSVLYCISYIFFRYLFYEFEKKENKLEEKKDF